MIHTKKSKLAFIIIYLVVFCYCCKKDNASPSSPSTNPTTNVSELSISSFAPSTAAIGTNITITGTNFSTTAANNIVKINNIIANVSSASATQLIVQVPNGATTGKISVSVGDKTATSTNDFIVSTSTAVNPNTLQITSFDPVDGHDGDVVTIKGSQFSTTIADNIVDIAGLKAEVINASATELKIIVPKNTTSPYGIDSPINITVNGKTAASANKFYIFATAYKVYFNLNYTNSAGVTAPEYAVANYSSNFKANPPASNKNPSRESHDFKGWGANATTKTPFDFSKTIITNNTTLYAIWMQKLTSVTYATNTFTAKHVATLTSSVDDNIRIDAPAVVGEIAPTEGYKFSLGTITKDYGDFVNQEIAGDICFIIDGGTGGLIVRKTLPVGVYSVTIEVRDEHTLRVVSTILTITIEA